MSLRYDLAFVLILLNLVLGSTQISASENTLEKLKKVSSSSASNNRIDEA